ncbi:class I SAM-dependent methyltransferase [Oleiharenicola lentus]|uniref:class I SAM-dependent methyltransferase n=1 Tax=Oleiharenicola lentus TaxID=2508720 RepID=UPI003F66F7D1
MTAAVQRPSLFTSIASWFKRRVLRDQRERWNHQYAEGRWEKLKAPLELARLDACASQLHRQGTRKSVLEIGSGAALLQQRVAPDDYSTWLGIDVSDLAIAEAQAFANHRVRYLVADMTTFVPDQKFDVIIFPESIYYTDDRAGLLKRYAQFLNPNGVFIVSIFQTKRSGAIWKEIRTVAYPVYFDATTNELGTWYCETLKLRNTATK